MTNRERIIRFIKNNGWKEIGGEFEEEISFRKENNIGMDKKL